MYVATDCIVFGYDSNDLKLLLFQRKLSPFKGEWSLIGTFVHLDESIAVAAERVLEQTTGLTDIFMEQTLAYGDVKRDPGYRCISIAKYALIRLDEHDKKSVEQYGAKWFSLDDLPPMILDHQQMINDALDMLKEKAKKQPVGFELLPKKFTLPQLQRLYELIYQKEIDSRNFRKKVLSLNILIKLEEKDKSNSKKGAFLYKFNSRKYNQYFTNGFNFDT
ncbi:NrtR DNA-binding winged helix domain-containing protein [Allomuricauda sp. SCSIO 65647]|uniref:NUDIX hydrolase n=1 Tax=Allomuricauda sp. SCSIO 65647 TaxID=2908843 RepID=UPI001F46E318|nr:NUDIX domain-containing protein [Muricauda sp. SCSIO 65647]UJH67828.1 NUDIX domain-containing protein [Muricauda sp. SCSIO 65647]